MHVVGPEGDAGRTTETIGVSVIWGGAVWRGPAVVRWCDPPQAARAVDSATAIRAHLTRTSGDYPPAPSRNASIEAGPAENWHFERMSAKDIVENP